MGQKLEILLSTSDGGPVRCDGGPIDPASRGDDRGSYGGQGGDRITEPLRRIRNVVERLDEWAD